MNPSRSFRRWFLGTLVAATALVVVFTAAVLGVHFWADWREQTVQHALNESRSPAFWWPKSWRVELAVRQKQREIEWKRQEIERLILELHAQERSLREQLEQSQQQLRAHKQRPIDWAGL